MPVIIYNSLDSVPDLEQLWAGAAPKRQFHDGDFNSFKQLVSQPGVQARIVVSREPGLPTVVAPFFLAKDTKPFSVGEKTLFSINAATLTLYSQWLLAGADESQIQSLFAELEKQKDFDWLDMGELPSASTLQLAVRNLNWRWIVTERGRVGTLRWLIDLPKTYDDFLMGLRPKSRQSLKRKCRKLEKDFKVEFRLVSQHQDIEAFLELGENVSRKTYQWSVGQRLNNDSETKASFLASCDRGELRSYLLLLDGDVCAFMRGSIVAGVYNYETPGFDPAFGKYSIGSTMLLYALKEIIENTECSIFDFGTGGDETGYKSTFGTRSIPCNHFELGRRRSPKSQLLANLQVVVNGTKKAGHWLLGSGDIGKRLKRTLRRSA